MQAIVDVFKQSLHPASSLTIIILFAVGAVLLYYRGGAWGRRWVAAVALAYWCLSTPACAFWLEWPLRRNYVPIRTADQAAGARVIVVLTAGTFTFSNGTQSVTTLTEESARRALEAARLYVLLGRATIIASGGTPMPSIQRTSEGGALADALVQLGVPRHDIVLEAESKTTHEEAVLVRSMLATRQAERFLLVTSGDHMRRSIAVFEAQGLHPIPAVAVPDYRFSPSWLYAISEYLPSRRGLLKSDATLYEYAALLYYGLRGRLGPAG